MKQLGGLTDVLIALAALNGGRQTPLLVIRIAELERIAWVEGRRAARQLEKHCVDFVVQSASSLLRNEDLIAHQPGSGEILIVLGSRHSDQMHPLPPDARMIVERIARTLERTSAQAIIRGWVMVGALPSLDELGRKVIEALERGAHERERYAFFSTIGHELRTPLTAIRGYIETLLEGRLSAATRKRFLEVAHAESLRVERLVEGMFDVSLLDLQIATRNEKIGDSAKALSMALNAMSLSSQALGIRFEVCDEGHSCVALGHDQLVQIYVNLLENAMKHGGDHGRIRISNHIENGRCLVIGVEDDGPGIPADARERVFQLGERGNTKSPGTGLGLAVVRLLAERAGGCVTCEVSPLGGCAFWVRLPIRLNSAKKPDCDHRVCSDTLPRPPLLTDDVHPGRHLDMPPPQCLP